ncbi:hypothetical protein [Massilia niabensis]|uniref:Uncharacterized protein n=1 Tax=Massilia niabensis TaxID=544910 RepID=A0ABW0L9Y8_9BURK
MHAIKLVPHAALLPAASASVKATRLSLARSQSTLFPTRLALARWTAGGDVPHLHSNANANAPLRAAWLTRAQRDFQAWLDSGGFVQHDGDDAAEDAAPGV